MTGGSEPWCSSNHFQKSFCHKRGKVCTLISANNLRETVAVKIFKRTSRVVFAVIFLMRMASSQGVHTSAAQITNLCPLRDGGSKGPMQSTLQTTNRFSGLMIGCIGILSLYVIALLT
ncbi:hypothetical protein AVEN_177936-1 [Araneus ventricosus]|uniref:Uncharacterized protein n=1 Tax=Araneus ventricosus TaxID=182803 RepID=A0A4Y2WC63_ARAVE|nr:hypothetical protein AVEN_177936-1 [Araneus ventricosus]